MIDFSDYFNGFFEIFLNGFAAGIGLGFIAWALGFAIYGFIKLVKLSS